MKEETTNLNAKNLEYNNRSALKQERELAHHVALFRESKENYDFFWENPHFTTS